MRPTPAEPRRASSPTGPDSRQASAPMRNDPADHLFRYGVRGLAAILLPPVAALLFIPIAAGVWGVTGLLAGIALLAVTGVALWRWLLVRRPYFYRYDELPPSETRGEHTWIVSDRIGAGEWIRKQWIPMDAVDEQGRMRTERFLPDWLRTEPAPRPEDGTLSRVAQIFWACMIWAHWKSVERRVGFSERCERIVPTRLEPEVPMAWREEWCGDPLTPRTAPADVLDQMRELDDFAREAGVYLVDLHVLNVRVDGESIRMIDGEFLVWWEFLVCRLFYPILRGVPMQRYADFRRIYWANEGRCPVDAVWNEAQRERYAKCRKTFGIAEG